MDNFREELRVLINRHSRENESNTPDFILADHLIKCLEAFEETTNKRTGWYSTDAPFPEPEVIEP